MKYLFSCGRSVCVSVDDLHMVGRNKHGPPHIHQILENGYKGTMQLFSKAVHHNCGWSGCEIICFVPSATLVISSIGISWPFHTKNVCSVSTLPRAQAPVQIHLSLWEYTFSAIETSNRSLGRTALCYSQLLLLSPNSWYTDSKCPKKTTFFSLYL